LRTAIGALAVLALAAGAAGFGLVLALQPPRLAVPAASAHVFRGVTLIEPGSAPRPGRTLRVAGGRIAAIEPTVPLDDGAGDAPDLAGAIVVPGLIDMHVHYPPALAVGNRELWSLLLLAHGVTAIREMGSVDGSIFAVREAIRAGRAPGPRIFACGEILDGDPPSFPSNRVVRTAAEAREAVEEQAARGADCIKVYNRLSRDALDAVRETAARLGLPVIGHAPHAVSLEEAGLADLQHGTGAVPIDRARVGRQDFRSEDWARVDEARIAYVAEVSLRQGIAHTPTLCNARMRRLLLDPAAADSALAADTGLRHLPSFWPDVWASLWGPPFAPGDAAGAAAHAQFRARQAELAARLHAAGVRVHAGTDTMMPFVAPGSSLHCELAELAAAGIAPDDVWAIATTEAGQFLGEPGLGTLEVGAPADLLFLRADPSGNLAALRDIEAVLAAGRLYRRADLETDLARFDAHFHGALYETVMRGIVRLALPRFAPGKSAE
jgi:imidazolonepropionase-like amidohydrolase